jgi:divalent metal cation (Fe/Co/Zn/Cd) transporter
MPSWGGAFIAEGISWTLATRKLLKEKEADENIWQTLRRSKDPSTFVVFGEDSAALAGLVVAFLGIFLEEQSGSHYPDVIASLVIGLILALVAFFLAYESKSLLIGEAADMEVTRSIRKLVQKDPAVEKAHRLISIQLSPREVFLAMDVKFKPDLPSRDLVTTIDGLERKIRAEHKKVKEIFIEADRVDSGKGKSKKAA